MFLQELASPPAPVPVLFTGLGNRLPASARMKQVRAPGQIAAMTPLTTGRYDPPRHPRNNNNVGRRSIVRESAYIPSEGLDQRERGT